MGNRKTLRGGKSQEAGTDNPDPKGQTRFRPLNDPLIRINDPIIPLNDPIIPLNDPIIPLNDPIIPINDPIIPINDPIIPINETFKNNPKRLGSIPVLSV